MWRQRIGEYILYYRGKIVGGIYDDRLLVKPVKSVISLMSTATYELPYEGAKETLLVDNVDSKEFLSELFDGAEHLQPEDIQHSIMVIKINKRYRRDMSATELYDVVRGIWRASLNSIKRRKVEYVFGVYNQLIVAVYKPDEWHYA